MLLQKSSPRGSKYLNKIDPITVHVAYEGKEDEKEYFSSLSLSLKKRFRHTVKLIPVEKTGTKSSPEHVKNDLVQHLKLNKINLNRTTSHLGFIVIDKDHYFNGTHAKSTRNAISDCKKRGIKVLCSNPCFEVWLLCHYIDFIQQDEEFLSKAIKNKRIDRSKNAKTFLKSEYSNHRNGATIDEVLKLIKVAYENEIKLKESCEEPDKIPPDGIMSNVGVIIKTLIDNGVLFFD